MKLRSMRLLAAISAPLLLLAACGSDDDSSSGTTTTTAAESQLEGGITVFAAASLTDAFDEVGAAFEAANPGTTVEFNFAASSALREQIIAGAPADVFASANTSNMDQVVEAGDAERPGDLRGEPAPDRRARRATRRASRGWPTSPNADAADRPLRRGGPVRRVRPRGAGQRRRDTVDRHQRARRPRPAHQDRGRRARRRDRVRDRRTGRG